MIRNTFFALLAVFAVAATSQAAVMIQADNGTDTLDLPGFKTYQLTAVSDDPITAVDFVGDGSTEGPDAKGFFGDMNQVVLFGGAVSTIFSDNNVVIDGQEGLNQAMDSQFSVNSTTVVVPPGLAKESATSLQAAYAWAESPGTSIPLAQLVIPNATLGSVSFNGAITVNIGGDNIDVPVSGMVPMGELLLPDVGDLSLETLTLNEVLSDTVAVSNVDVLGFDDAANPTFTPLIGGKPLTLPNLPTLDAAGNFSWDTKGALRGLYEWGITGSNTAGSDPGTISVRVTQVPEPATLSLFGLALVGIVGIARKRS